MAQLITRTQTHTCLKSYCSIVVLPSRRNTNLTLQQVYGVRRRTGIQVKKDNPAVQRFSERNYFYENLLNYFIGDKKRVDDIQSVKKTYVPIVLR